MCCAKAPKFGCRELLRSMQIPTWSLYFPSLRYKFRSPCLPSHGIVNWGAYPASRDASSPDGARHGWKSGELARNARAFYPRLVEHPCRRILPTEANHASVDPSPTTLLHYTSTMLAPLPNPCAIAASLVEPCLSLELCLLTGCGCMTA
jgi:hypothetical protein